MRRFEGNPIKVGTAINKALSERIAVEKSKLSKLPPMGENYPVFERWENEKKEH
jgi:hypothetical protein